MKRIKKKIGWRRKYEENKKKRLNVLKENTKRMKRKIWRGWRRKYEENERKKKIECVERKYKEDEKENMKRMKKKIWRKWKKKRLNVLKKKIEVGKMKKLEEWKWKWKLKEWKICRIECGIYRWKSEILNFKFPPPLLRTFPRESSWEMYKFEFQIPARGVTQTVYPFLMKFPRNVSWEMYYEFSPKKVSNFHFLL
jgi:hypothetical protein